MPTFKQIRSMDEFVDAIRIRADVFIKEQGFQPGWEPDELDKGAIHFAAVDNGKIIATARARKTRGREFRIERMAVLSQFRQKGVGAGLLKFIVKSLNEKKPKRIWLASQLQASKFYGKNGFKAVSEPYDLHGVRHVDMDLTKL